MYLAYEHEEGRGGEGRGGEGRRGERMDKKKREGKGEPVGIHPYFDCSSFTIYAGPSINYSNVRSSNNNNNNKKYISCVASAEICLKLEFRVHYGCMKLRNWHLLLGSFIFSYK